MDQRTNKNRPWKKKALHAASAIGNVVLARALIDSGAEVSAKDDLGRTPIYTAARNRHLEVLKVLVEAGGDVDIQDGDGRTALYVAALRGHIEEARLLVHHGAAPSQENHWGWTPLALALRNGHVKIATMLIENGADSSSLTPEGWRPIHWASRDGFLDVVRALLQRGVDLEILDDHGWTSFQIACFNWQVHVVEFLLDNGANITAREPTGNTPLISAAERGDIDLVRLIVDRYFDVSEVNADGMTALNAAAEHDHVEVVKILLKKGATMTPDKSGYTPLHTAAIHGKYEVIEALIANGADVSAYDVSGATSIRATLRFGWMVLKSLAANGISSTLNRTRESPLFLASRHGHIECVRLLIERGASVMAIESRGWTPLHAASEQGHVDVIQLLLNKGATMTGNNVGETPLHLASFRGHLDAVEELLRAGADISAGVKGGLFTPLHLAAQTDQAEVVGVLLEHGAYVDILAHFKTTPLHTASAIGRQTAMNVLLKHGADPNAVTMHTTTPIHMAAMNGHIEAVKLLLEHGANPNAATMDEMVAIHIATEKGQIAVVKLLLEYGADPNTVNVYGLTPIHVASEKGDIEVVKLLLEHGSSLTVAGGEIGFTPLQLAAKSGHVELVELLIEKQADPEIAKKDGRPTVDPHLLSAYVAIAKEKRYLENLFESSTPLVHPAEQSWFENQGSSDGSVGALKSTPATDEHAEDGSSRSFTQSSDQKISRPPVVTNHRMLCNVCLDVFQKGAGRVNLDAFQKARDMAFLYTDNMNSKSPMPAASTDHQSSKQSYQFFHHMSLRNLASASEQGCYICKVVWEPVSAQKRAELMNSESVAIANGKDIGPVSFCTLIDPDVLFLGGTRPEDAGKDERLWAVSLEPEIAVNLNRGPAELPMFRIVPVRDIDQPRPAVTLASATDSEQSLAFATSKFQDCMQNHEACKKSRSSGWVPSRLICLDNAAKDGTVYLVSRDRNPDQYCTLSHRWGRANFLKLTKSNLELFHHGIWVSSLPRTFRDSFLVARKLGIRYIWIDSLCIIQDDPDDWLAEASQMHQVYSNSLCNINATRSMNSTGGLFTTRDVAIFEPCDVEIPWFDGGGIFRVMNFGAWNSQVLEAPLNTRAWVVQEHFLAPRHLHFGSTQIFWECVQTTLAEEFPEKIPEAIQLTGQSSRRQLHGFDTAGDSEARAKQLRSAWVEIVRRYTSCQLSHWSDRVIAFSGIAHRYEYILGDKCEGGIWRHDIERDLLWHVEGCRKGDGTPSELPKTYRAPSFSWMCIEGKILASSDDITREPLVEVVSMTIEESRGMITSGSIRLKGMLRTLRLHRPGGSLWGMWTPKFRHGKPELGWAMSTVSSALMDTEGNYSDTYYCILISETYMTNWTAGLILRETGRARGEFTRIGLLQCTGEDKELIRYEYGGEELYPCEAYDSVERRHTICIV